MMKTGTTKDGNPSPARGGMFIDATGHIAVSPVRGDMKRLVSLNRPYAAPTGLGAFLGVGFYKHAGPTGLKTGIIAGRYPSPDRPPDRVFISASLISKNPNTIE